METFGPLHPKALLLALRGPCRGLLRLAHARGYAGCALVLRSSSATWTSCAGCALAFRLLEAWAAFNRLRGRLSRPCKPL